MKIYLAARWAERDILRQWRDAIEQNPLHKVVSRWIDLEEPDRNEPLWERGCAFWCLTDLGGADLLIIYSTPGWPQPTTDGLWVEFGWALASEFVDIWLVGPRTNIFTWIYGVRQFDTWEAALSQLAARSG